MNKFAAANVRILFCKLCCLLFYWNFLTEINGASGVTAREDLALTKQEKAALDKFRSKVLPFLPHSYMKHELYLIRWLRARDLNVNAAEEMLKDNLRWRHAQKMDKILQEDWSDMEDNFLYTNNTFDKAGRPVVTISAIGWDVRKMALAGQGPRFLRHFARIFEELQQRIFLEQKKGKAVTRWTGVINLDGFNQIQHACPLCLPLYLGLVDIAENRYPQEMNKMILINTPGVFKVVSDLINPAMSPELRRSVLYLGLNKREWMKYLDREISIDQRTPEFGGTMKTV